MDIIFYTILFLLQFGGFVFYLFILFGGENGRALTPNEVFDLFHKKNKKGE